MSVKIRNVGKLEQMSTARHSLGFYQCVAQTARYRLDQALPDVKLRIIVTNALRLVISKHVPLQCGIADEDTRTPFFVSLPEISMQQVLSFETIVTEQEDHDQALLRLLDIRHSTGWEDVATRPPWQAIVLREPYSENEDAVFDLIFAFHHALIDGLGGLVFHYDFLQALRHANEETTAVVLLKSSLLNMKQPLEELITLTISWSFFLRELWTALAPSWLQPAKDTDNWTGRPVSFPGKGEVRTLIRLITISNSIANKLLLTCRAHHTTLTGLLHGCILAALAIAVPTHAGFAAATPYNLRGLNGTSATADMAVQVSILEVTYNKEQMDKVRAVLHDLPALEASIWDVAESYKAKMVAEQQRLPNDNIVAMLRYVNDFHEFYTSRLGKSRAMTYEISNVGTLTPPATHEPLETTSLRHVKIERNIFSQSASVTGQALTFSVSSVKDGPLNICLTWQEGIVEDEITQAIAMKLQDLLETFATDI